MMFWWILVVMSTNIHAASIETSKLTKTKSNLFNPVLSASSYLGFLKENERIVRLEPVLSASDVDLSSSVNGQICGYELSKYKHDDIVDDSSQLIPFTVEIIDGQVVIKLKSSINELDCEVQQTYRLFIRAYDCAVDNARRYSERSSLTIMIDDINEFPPVFTQNNYLFKLHQDQTCSSCRVEATDDDCTNVNHRVCDYRIITSNVSFAIDSNGLISIIKPLIDQTYEFDVVAIDCYPSSSTEKNITKISQPARVTIKRIPSCKPIIEDNNPTKLTILSDHTHVFDTVHVNTCDDTCVVEDIVGTIELNSDGLDSHCNAEQCSSIYQEYILIANDPDSNKMPESHFMSFRDHQQAFIVPKSTFSGHFKPEFIIRVWMKHNDDDSDDKQHLFCSTDEKFKNRHHTALFIENDRLKLLIRQQPVASNANTVYPSEWTWKLPQINDDQWHSYKFFVNYPNNIDLYVDDQLITLNNDSREIIADHALAAIEETADTVFTLGACWHGRASRMVQYFHGQLAGLSIEQKDDGQRSETCVRDCRQYLEMPDVQKESGIECTSNANRSVWVVRTDSAESFEQLLKRIVYRNTFDPIGPSGQRTISIQTTVKCLGENYTYNLPVFTRRLSIDETLHPVTIELKGDTTFLVTEPAVNQGIYLFQNVSIYTDALNKNQVDITDCSIGTSPEFASGEQLIVPRENLDINNLAKVPTQTGLILSGAGSIDSYQYILQQISFISQSPLKYLDRTFSLVCIGANEQTSTNEIRIQIHVQKQVAAPVPVAAVLSNELFINNDLIRDSIDDVDGYSRSMKNTTVWPIAAVVCVSVGLAGALVLYLVVRTRSGFRQRGSCIATGDDVHAQMEWEDDIGLNIIVNPLDETKKSVVAMKLHDMEQTIHVDDDDCTDSEDDEEYSSGEEDGEEDEEEVEEEEDEDEEDDEDDEDEGNDKIRSRKHEHQLEWDDAAVEYGPKKV